MDRTIVWSSSITGAACALVACLGYRALAEDRGAIAALEERVASLSAQASEPRDAPDAADASSARLDAFEARFDELRVRIVRLEQPPRREAVEQAPVAVPAIMEDVASGGAAADVAEFEALLSKMLADGWDFSRSSDEFERFLELARSTDLLDARIDELESRVAAAPENIELRLALARTYEGKLMTVAGPEQGLWGGRAEQQHLTIVDIDGEQLTSHAWLGSNYSYYPEVMGKTANAIDHLERARELQRSIAPDLEHVRTYLFLARMYERDGKPDEARDVLVEGLGAFPASADLDAALARLE